jgi:hypothetical protein
MSATPQNPSKAALGFAIMATIAAIAFASLWLRETARKPKEVTKEIVKRVEVPVEKIREVPKEVVKEVLKQVEVPAKLTDDERMVMELGRRFLSASVISKEDEPLQKIASVGVVVRINDAAKKALSEDRVKNKFELILRKHEIPLDAKSRHQLLVAVEGLWDKEEIQLTYSLSMELSEFVTITRGAELRRAMAIVWQNSAYGFAGRTLVEEALLDTVDEMGEAFANKYLAARDAERKKASHPSPGDGLPR